MTWVLEQLPRAELRTRGLLIYERSPAVSPSLAGGHAVLFEARGVEVVHCTNLPRFGCGHKFNAARIATVARWFFCWFKLI